jgi:hypothetical protein
VILSSFESASVYRDPLRRVSHYDAETGKRLKFLTNNFALPALTIAQIYKQRWQVELFFKWIKQHLWIKACYQRERGEDANLDRGVGFTCWWPSRANGWGCRPVCTKSYKFSALRVSRKRPFHAPFRPLIRTRISPKIPTN